jgi:hypothetical protein
MGTEQKLEARDKRVETKDQTGAAAAATLKTCGRLDFEWQQVDVTRSRLLLETLTARRVSHALRRSRGGKVEAPPSASILAISGGQLPSVGSPNGARS